MNAHGLFVDDALVARREEIRSALLLELGQPGPTLWIYRRFPSPLTVRVISAQRGHHSKPERRADRSPVCNSSSLRSLDATGPTARHRSKQ
jgi:hypothetical protein